MALEIEHKYLVKSSDYRTLAEPVRFRQGYLVTLPDKTVRVRIAGIKGFLTIKSRVSNFSRREYEYEIPVEDAEMMLNHLCSGLIIEKYRYRVLFDGFIWEVDEYFGENKGLITAEIEVTDENQQFAVPDWVGKEITSDLRYLNSNLSKLPFNQWDH